MGKTDPEQPPVSKAGKTSQAATRIAKALLSLILLVILIWKAPVSQALDGLLELSIPGLLAIVVLSFAFPALAALRWKRVLSYLNAKHPFTPLMADTLVSSTYNMLLPTNIGGDVVRALRCSRRLEQKHQAWSSVLFERLVGIVALALLAVPGLAMVPGPMRTLGWAVGAVVLLSVVVLVFAATPFRLAGKLLAARAPIVAGAGERIADDLAGPLGKTIPRFETMAWSTAYQTVGLGILVVVALDWGTPEMAWAIIGGVPLVLILTLLPISIAGLGVRESLFVVLLGQLGVELARALSLAVVWLASALLLALAGALVIAFERPKKRLSTSHDPSKFA